MLRAQAFLAHLIRCASMSLDELPIILPGGFIDALSGGAHCAEGCHERAVLAAQENYVWIRLVDVVVELGKPELFHLLLSPPTRERHQGLGGEISSRSSGQNSRYCRSGKRTSTATYSSPP